MSSSIVEVLQGILVAVVSDMMEQMRLEQPETMNSQIRSMAGWARSKN